MMISRAYKTQLDPTPAQVQAFILQSDVTRFVFNWALGKRQEHYKETGKQLSAVELIKEFRAVRKVRDDLAWTAEASSRAEESALRRLDAAYKNFFEKRTKFPRFKRWRDGIVPFSYWSLKPEHVQERAIRLQGIGWVRLQEAGYLPQAGAKINSATVSERIGKWFVSLQVEEEVADTVPTGETLGVDAGVSRLATVSDGRVYEAPKALYAVERKLAHLQRKLCRQVKGSAGREETKARIAKLHYRIANLRKSMIHEASADILSRHGEAQDQPERVGVEGLNVKGMMANHCLAKAVGDASMGELLRQIGYKAAWQGTAVVTADQWFPSSSTCSRCGWKVAELSLGQRVFRCAQCGLEVDRDYNAAVNLAKLAQEQGESENAGGGRIGVAVGSRPARPAPKRNAGSTIAAGVGG